jgi:hypothetical protein
MATNNRIKVSDLDYNQIRENLKTFMKGQSEFSDYDFDGSALSVLIDVLAYNTHYNALYTNLAINEMYLDSASKRSSLVSIANNFGYTPRSVATSQAIVNLVNTDIGSTDQLRYIPKWSSFSTSIDGKPYGFWTIEDYTSIRTGTTYTFNNVKLYEGLPQTQLFVCTQSAQKFTLPNENIDIDTITVTVQPTSEQPDYEKYTRAEDVLQLTPDSKIYYIKELEDGTYQLYFGTNDLGKPLSIGNIITVQYLISNKDAANGASLFTYTGQTIAGTLSISTVATSYGGSDKESSDEIRSNVGQAFFDQNRTVTPSDYRAIIQREYPNVDSISVWGGEDNVPPVYGKVYIAVKPTNSLYLTPTEKTFIKERILKPRNVVSVTPEFIDPSYVELEVNTTVYYNKNKTSRSADQLKVAVGEAITNYTNTNLKKFDGIFRMSKFQANIDAVDQSILSNITTFKAFIEVTPKYNIFGEYTLNFVNPIYNEGVPEEAFYTTGFYIDNTSTTYNLDDDGNGNIRLITINSSTGAKAIVNPSIGSVNYDTGTIKISGLRITNLVEPNFYFIIKTSSYDVASVRNQIVDIPSSRVTVNVIDDVTSSGTYLGGTNYTFTSSRN